MNCRDVLVEARDTILAITHAEWHPDFIAGKYDSDEPEENAMRQRVNTSLANIDRCLGVDDHEALTFHKLELKA